MAMTPDRERELLHANNREVERRREAETERDQLRAVLEPFAKVLPKDIRTQDGWYPADIGMMNGNVCQKIFHGLKIEHFWKATEALATPHTAATPAPYDDLSRLEADRIIDAARNRQTADSVQVRTPGTIEVCAFEYADRPCGSSPPTGWAQCRQPNCPIRPKQGV